MQFAFVVAVTAILLALMHANSVQNDGEQQMLPVVDRTSVPANLCVTNEKLHEATENMLDDFVSFGITDKHAEEFTGWIVNDVVIAANDLGNIKCVPPSRTNEMGTRLGKIIAQDIAGERPSKRGRPEVSEELDFDIENDAHRKGLDLSGVKTLDATDRQGAEKNGEPKNKGGEKKGDNPKHEGQDKKKAADDAKKEGVPKWELEEKEKQGNSQKKNGPAKRLPQQQDLEKKKDNEKEDEKKTAGTTLFKFNFLGEKNSDESLVKKNCCECPEFHYPAKADKTCAKGPCCPTLCRTLERLAGALSSAKIPCCEKAHLGCRMKERMSLFKLAMKEKPPAFKFSFERREYQKKNEKNTQK